MQLEMLFSMILVSISLANGRIVAASTRDVPGNITQNQEIESIGYTGLGQTEQALFKPNGTPSGIIQLGALENLTQIQEISAEGNLGMGPMDLDALKPVVSSSDSAQLGALENFTHFQSIPAVGDRGIGHTEKAVFKPSALLLDSGESGVLENKTHIQEGAGIKDKSISQTERRLLKPIEMLFAPIAKATEVSGSKLLPSQPLEDHHVLQKELFKTANNIQNTSTQRDGGQMFLDINPNDLSNQILDKRNPELVELGAVKGKPKVPGRYILNSS